jgi:hypothetical protein
MIHKTGFRSRLGVSMKRCHMYLFLVMSLIMVLCVGDLGFAYPLDGYGDTGIRRIEAARLAVMGKMRGRPQPPGALLPLRLVDLRLLDHKDMELPGPDPEFTRQIISLLGENADRYGIAVLDLTDINHPRYAEHRADFKQNVGSVGKIVVALAMFQALADIYPDDIAARKRVLRDTIITADEFIQHDHHKVRIYDTQKETLNHRKLQIGDQGTLYDFMDWMLSASSNAAAALMMKHAMLIKHFGKDYPVPEAKAEQFFKKTSKKQLQKLYEETFFAPLTRNGFDLDNFRQGSFFTRYGKQHVPGTSSYGTARELMRYFLRMEQGRLVDEFSSREIKRLLYMTERRIRYASSPTLADSAVYFKSGSLYSCKKEPGFVCRKYRGNKKNYMNSIAVVETPAGVNRLYYMATLISNVLYKNSAVDHQTLATYIHRNIEAAHPQAKTPEGQVPAELTFGNNLIGYHEKQKQRLMVAETQAALLKRGYDIGKVDGKFGPKTAAAIKKFQKDHQLKIDGKISEALLEKIRAD